LPQQDLHQNGHASIRSTGTPVLVIFEQKSPACIYVGASTASPTPD
jgi:hypothetical protein